ncbi:MAG TPA: methyltransferase domain-containing protein [Candidatus Saccharimonadales bacterium]|nr:methyltransferase domain-containing protein [Candidatus Saccharimonadales bacterium]
MNDTPWQDLHNRYKDQDWIDKPSLFAQTAITYFPSKGRVLDLGAGQGQDSRYFAEHGYDVASTDLEETALEQSRSKLPDELKQKITIRKIDLREELPFEDGVFDVVYAHLSLHYFDYETTVRLFDEIQRVMKPGGILAFFTNSIHDPQYNTGTKLEEDYFQIGDKAKRYFSVSTARAFTKYFDVSLLDDQGETYKDNAIGVHNLIRFIGAKRAHQPFTMAIPYCGAIVEREQNGEKEVLMQTRWKPHRDPVYSGTLEFPAGVLDKPFEDVHDALAREIKEEAGLTLKAIKQDNRTPALGTGKDDSVIGFRPYCCTQQLNNGKPWIGFVFICEVEPGEPTAQLSEAKDAKWMKVSEVKELYEKSPEKFFGLELPAWHYYFNEMGERA